MYDVIVIGCGPVGAVAANMLGLHGLKTLILERELSDHGQPRAFSCDDEGMRTYQYIGLDEQMRGQMFADSYVDYSGVNGRFFAEILVDQVDFGYGFRPLYFFHQPMLEATLRNGLTRFPTVTFQAGKELTDLQQTIDSITVEVRDTQTGTVEKISARYLLGCDGGRSTVRKLLNIPLDGIHYEEPWLAVSGVAQEGSTKLNHVRFVCNPDRPTFVGPAPFNQYRMEFKLNEGETAAEMENPAKVRELISPYVDPDQFTIQRAAVYTFHNATARQWRDRRTFLLGDAAHMMPPFMGQGLNSGLRDAFNLTWKLTLVIKGCNPAILDTFEQERRPHTLEMSDISVKMGYIFLTRKRWAAHLRDHFFLLIQKIPAVREAIRKFKFKPKAIYPKGLFLNGGRTRRKSPEGTCFPQPLITDKQGKPVRLDDLTGKGFCVISRSSLPAVKDPELWAKLNTCFIQIGTDVFDKTGALNRWFDQYQADFAVIRPDHFVFAAGRDFPVVEQAMAITFK